MKYEQYKLYGQLLFSSYGKITLENNNLAYKAFAFSLVILVLLHNINLSYAKISPIVFKHC